MVQEVLQRRREPWRWGAQSAAVRDWQQPVERIIETDRSSYNDTGGHQRTQRWPFYGHSAFEASWKGEKSSISGCLMSLQNRKKKHFGELSSLILCNNNTTRGLGTANEHTVQWWFKKFCKGDKHFEDEECSGRLSEVDPTDWANHQSWSSYNYTRSFPRTQH